MSQTFSTTVYVQNQTLQLEALLCRIDVNDRLQFFRNAVVRTQVTFLSVHR